MRVGGWVCEDWWVGGFVVVGGWVCEGWWMGL